MEAWECVAILERADQNWHSYYPLQERLPMQPWR